MCPKSSLNNIAEFVFRAASHNPKLGIKSDFQIKLQFNIYTKINGIGVVKKFADQIAENRDKIHSCLLVFAIDFIGMLNCIFFRDIKFSNPNVTNKNFSIMTWKPYIFQSQHCKS